jgi:hypothetical protein
MTNELIPNNIMDFYDKGKKMDKQNYKELLAETMAEATKCEKETGRLQLLVAQYQDKLNHIWHMVEDTPNDNELGKKMRKLYHEKDKISRT